MLGHVYEVRVIAKTRVLQPFGKDHQYRLIAIHVEVHGSLARVASTFSAKLPGCVQYACARLLRLFRVRGAREYLGDV